MTPFADAIFSPDREHRYRLMRSWDRTKPTVAWVMLNPSIADALRDDPTMRRVQKFSVRLGFGALQVVNLFSRVATNPDDLIGKKTHELIGPEAFDNWVEAAKEADTVIAAWGAMKVFDEESARARALEAVAFFKEMSALEVLAGGMPKHPLYCDPRATLVEFAKEGKFLPGSPLALDATHTESGNIGG